MASQFYPPVIGGQEQVVRNLSHALVRRGHEVVVATLQMGGPAYEDDEGVRIHRIGGTFRRFDRLFTDPQRRHVPPIPDPEAVRALGRLIDRERPDVVHAHDWLVHSLVGFRRRKHVPIVLSLHDYSLVCANKRLIAFERPCDGPSLGKCVRCARNSYGVKGVPIAVALRAAQSRLRSNVDRFLPVSEAVATLCGVRTSGVSFTVVPNFVPDAWLAASSEEHDVAELPASDFICFVGDVTHDKGVHVLLEAHRRLGSNTPLVLIGRPILPAVGEPLSNVFVLGSRPHAFVREALRRCAVAVVPSVWAEPFSLAALEAMLVGRPVVASRTGGLADVVHDGETGFLIAPGDAAALAESLARLLADPILREQMGDNGQARAREVFGEGAVVPLVERVYREVVERANTRGARRDG
jgi:glycosyltransferase involved in cell wall biosynthesis